MICMGIDWASQHHDVHLSRRGSEPSDSYWIEDNPDGYDELADRIHDLAESGDEPVCVA